MASVKKSSVKKTSKVAANKVAKKPAARKKSANKVDYYPNRMAFWVSAAAGSVLVLWAVMVAYT